MRPIVSPAHALALLAFRIERGNEKDASVFLAAAKRRSIEDLDLLARDDDETVAVRREG